MDQSTEWTAQDQRDYAEHTAIEAMRQLDHESRQRVLDQLNEQSKETYLAGDEPPF